jgi:hypothetical protein
VARLRQCTAVEQVAGAGGRRPTASEMRRARRMQREGRAAGRAAEVEGEDDGGGEEPDERQPAPGVRTRGKKKSANREAKREHKEYRDGEGCCVHVLCDGHEVVVTSGAAVRAWCSGTVGQGGQG